MTATTSGDGELRGVRVVYPERRLTVTQVATHLAALNDLWVLCNELDGGGAAGHRQPLDRQSIEQLLDNAVTPVRDMTDRLSAVLEERVAQEFGRPAGSLEDRAALEIGRRSSGGPTRVASASDCVEALRRLQKQMSASRLRGLAKTTDVHWKLTLAVHIEDMMPLASELVDRLSTRQSLAAEWDYAIQLIQAIRNLNLMMREDAGNAAITDSSALYQHYLNTMPNLDIIATVSGNEPQTAHAMYLVSAIVRDPQGVHRWLPGWVESQTPQRGGGWQRLMGGTPPGREQLERFAEEARILAAQLIGSPTDILVAGLGAPPADLT